MNTTRPNMVSSEMFEAAYGTMMTLFIVGLVCNLLTIIVLQKRNSLGTRLLLYLAFVDVAMLLLMFFLTVLRYYLPTKNHSVTDVAYQCLTPFLVPLLRTVNTSEKYITVLVAVQRCCILAIPLRFVRFTRGSVLNKALIGICVFSVVYNVPVWVGWKPEFYWNDRLNQTLIRTVRLTTMYRLYEASRIPVDSILPLVLILTCDVIMVISKFRSTPVPGQEKHTRGKNHLTNIVVCITTVSVILHTTVAWFYVYDILNVVPTRFDYGLQQIPRVFIFLNSAVNFFIYCLFGPEFRQTLMSVFRGNGNNRSQRSNAGLDGEEIEIHTLD